MRANISGNAASLIPDLSTGEHISPGGLIRILSRKFLKLKLGMREASGAFSLLMKWGDGGHGGSLCPENAGLRGHSQQAGGRGTGTNTRNPQKTPLHSAGVPVASGDPWSSPDSAPQGLIG